MHKAIIQRLLADTDVAAVVGTRVYPVMRDQKAPPPVVVYTPITHRPEYTLTEGVSLAESVAQIDCYATTFDSVQSLADAVRASLSGADFTYDGVTVQGLFIDRQRSSFEGDETAKLHRASIDIRGWHTDP